MSRRPTRRTSVLRSVISVDDDEELEEEELEETEWNPRNEDRDSVEEEEEEQYYDPYGDDGADLRDFIVEDGEGEEEEDDRGGDDDEISEAEEDNDFEQPLNRPIRAQGTPFTNAKRTRIKRKRTDGGAEGEGTPRRRTRRRDLAAIRDDNDLDDSTARARQAEKERASHLQFTMDAEDAAANAEPLFADDEEAVPLVCLNPQSEDGTPPDGELGSEDQAVFAHPAVSGKLKKHQVKGAQFLWSHIAVEPHGFGCILADFMGLGKTLQVLTVVQAFLALKRRRPSDGELASRYKHVLILAPTICVRNWEAEVVKWFGKKDARKMGVHTLESSREKKMIDRVQVVKQWHRRGGLLIMGYELYRILVLQSSGDEKIAAGNAKHAHLIREAYQCLSDPGPDLIVLDEGHRVRDHKSKLVKALSHVKTARRIILTGYPLQNHLEEYWTMVNFARPDYLGTLEDFKNRFVHPIENGQCVDSTEDDRRIARQRAFVLTNELKTLVLRRDQEFLFKQLPPKKEWVFLCKLTENQAKLYKQFLEKGVPQRKGRPDVLGGYHISMAISNHPDVLKETFYALEEAVRSGKFAAGIKAKKRSKDDEDGGEDEDLLQYLAADLAKPKTGAARFSSGLSDDDDEDEDSILAALNSGPGGRGSSSIIKANKKDFDHRLGFARQFMHEYTAGMLESSGKMLLLMELLVECKAIGDRVILFSQSIPTLNTIERMIAQTNRRYKRFADRMTYLRIDGSTPQQERFRMISQFNDWEEPFDLIMISTKAGGEGVNLCAGNRIIIFDVCWNPCNDSQSMCRSYRFGQVKPVFVYRFVSAGTMEKKVYDLQIRKEGVAKRIVDEKALERKFKNADLQNYFNIEEFDGAMKQQSTVLAAPSRASMFKGAASEEKEITSLDDLLEGSTLFSSAPGNDTVLEKVLNKMYDEKLDWVLEWFEQETMFEETIDDNCTAAEQEEITASYTYVKALRQMKLDDPNWSMNAYANRDNMLVVACTYCRNSNDVYPEETTKVPLPKYIECRYCKRPTPTSSAQTYAQARAAYAANVANAAAGAVPGGLLPGGRGGYMPYTTATPGAVGLDTGGVGAIGSLPGPARILPPHLHALYVQQQQQRLAQQQQQQLQQQLQQQQDLDQHQELINQRLRHQQQAMAVAQNNAVRELMQRQAAAEKRSQERRQQERVSWKLSDRNLLILRRGINKVQDLKKSARDCGATIAIEVSPQLTDIVSGTSLDETLQWLKLTKLPRDVELHDEAWLRNEIAKEKGQPLPFPSQAPSSNGNAEAVKTAAVPTQSPATTTTSETPSPSSNDAGHDMIAIDSSDDEGGDDDVAMEAISTLPDASTTQAQDQDATEEEDDDDDIIEIL